jgi:hypothetical protein
MDPVTVEAAVELPSAANGWMLRVNDAAARKVEVLNTCGSVMVTLRNGSMGLGHLPDGLYFVRVTTWEGTRTLRTVLTR